MPRARCLPTGLPCAIAAAHRIPSLAAGFAEVAETLEQAVAREVLEESGELGELGVAGRQPGWAGLNA